MAGGSDTIKNSWVRDLLSLAAVDTGISAPLERNQEYHLLGRKLMGTDSTNTAASGRTNFRGNLRWGGRNHFSWNPGMQ
jgi:hypothetical protein